MGLRTALTNYLRRPVRSGPSYGYDAVSNSLPQFRLGKPTWPERSSETMDRKGYRQVALIYRCINLIAHAIGTAPLRVYDEDNDDETLPDHPLRQLMRQPNPQMGEAIFMANVALRAAVAGFCVVEKERLAIGGGVKALWPMQSAWLRAVPRADSRYDWDYHIPGIPTPYRLRSEDVVAFRWADTPDGSPYGIGPVAMALRSAALITKMVDFLGVLFERGGVPLYGIVPDLMPGQTLRQEQVDEMTERFIRRHGGIEQAAIPMIMAGIKDVKRLGFSMDELAYTDLRDVSELEIVQSFGVPPRKAMIRVGLEHTTQNATAQVEDAEFYRDTMLPLWTRFDDALTTSLLPDFEDPGTPISLEFDTSDIAALQPDRNARAPWLLQGFGLSAFSQHTLHRELGLPLPETPDFYVRGLALEAIPADRPLGSVAPALSPPQLGATTIREIQSGRGPAVRLAQATSNRKQIRAIADARVPSISAFFREQGNRVIDAVKAPVGVAALAGANGHQREQYGLIDVNWADEEYRLSQVLDRLYNLAGETSFKVVNDQLGLGLSWDLSNPRIRDVMNDLGTRVVGITEESRTVISEIVTAGQEAGQSVDQIAASLKDKYQGWSDSRALTIARSESQVSYNTASTVAYRESGVVDRLQLFDNPAHTQKYPGAEDGLSCAERNGKIVPLADGELHIRSEHPNGSLSVSPVLTGEDE